eukprot:gene13504-19363_t
MAYQWRPPTELLKAMGPSQGGHAKRKQIDNEARYIYFETKTSWARLGAFNRLLTLGLYPKKLCQVEGFHFIFETDEDYTLAASSWVPFRAPPRSHAAPILHIWEFSKTSCLRGGKYHRVFIFRRKRVPPKETDDATTQAAPIATDDATTVALAARAYAVHNLIHQDNDIDAVEITLKVIELLKALGGLGF